eukprot:gene5996-9994_t
MEAVPYDMIAINIFLMSFFILLFLSSLISLGRIVLLNLEKNSNTNEEEYNSTSKSTKTSNNNHSIRIQIYFYLFLLFGSFGRSMFFILDIINSFYKNSLLPKSIIKAFEYLPTYFFGILFVVLLLSWCEKYYSIQVNSGNAEQSNGAKSSLWWGEKIVYFGIFLYFILMIIDIINLFFLELINVKILFLILKNVTITFLLLYMDITGILFFYFGMKLYLMLNRLSKIINSPTIVNHKRKVLIVTLVGGFILIFKSGILLYHLISMIIIDGETPIENMLFIVFPYHLTTEIIPLAFFQIFLWRNNNGNDDEDEEEIEYRRRRRRCFDANL